MEKNWQKLLPNITVNNENGAVELNITNVESIRKNGVECFDGEAEHGENFEMLVKLADGSLLSLNFMVPSGKGGNLEIQHDDKLDTESEVSAARGNPLPSAPEVAEHLAKAIKGEASPDDAPLHEHKPPTKH